jgi:ABC-type phosphate/phosphonate transport system ATPase subunit
MKCAVVMASTLTKYNRWDPRFYFGSVKAEEEAVARALERVKDAKAAVTRAKRAVTAEKKRVAAMLAAEDVRPLDIKEDK